MDNINEPLNDQEQSSPELPITKERRTKKQSKKIVYLVYLLVALFGVFIAKTVLNIITKKVTAKDQKTVATPARVKRPSEIREKSTPPPKETSRERKPLPSLTLSGIFYDETQPCALINNRILKEGDIIQGAKIIKIHSNKIDLEFEGEVFELTTR